MTSTASKIMVIRHAEKPTPKISGVKETGDSSAHALIVRGWQRAGALATILIPVTPRVAGHRKRSHRLLNFWASRSI